MLEVVDSVVEKLANELDDQLEAIFLFGSLAQGHYLPGQSDINLFVVVKDGTAVAECQRAFAPVWAAHRSALKRAPYLAHKTAFQRHLQIDPLLAQHLVRDGQPCWGAPDFLDRRLATIDPHEGYASLVTEAMQTSAALAPQLLDNETAFQVRERLQRLARKLRNEPLPENETAVQSFARIQHFLNPIMARLPATQKWAGVVPRGTTSPLLPGLQTIYDETGTTILVFDQLTPQKIVQTDWAKLAARLPAGTKQLQVTTVEQISLSIMFERPLDLRFKKLKHSWGPNFLGAFNPNERQIMRYAARVPSRILVNELPQAYLTQAGKDEIFHKIIHDFQNKMLNIQLEHELLVRFGLCQRFKPPTPVPGRETPPQERVNALFQHLEWWSQFYADQL